MIAFFALVFAVAALGVALALGAQVRILAQRLVLVERHPERVPLEGRRGEPWERGSTLASLRVALAIQQDHPHPVFESLLKEALLREEAIVESPLPSAGEGEGDEGQILIEGEVVGNGYADVYFRAEIAATLDGKTLFVISDKPPHGDRPANLAAEVVQRLKDELAKRERRGALRELGR